MDFLILGLLLRGRMTLYEIRKKLENELNLLYSSSTGSIQSAIKKLLSKNYIHVREGRSGGREKKYYEITEDGRSAFQQWIDSDIASEKSRMPELLKFYFMGFSNVADRMERIQKHVEYLQKAHEKLKERYEKSVGETPLEQQDEVYKYQLMTLKFGVDFTAFQVEWFQSALAQGMEEK